MNKIHTVNHNTNNPHRCKYVVNNKKHRRCKRMIHGAVDYCMQHFMIVLYADEHTNQNNSKSQPVESQHESQHESQPIESQPIESQPIESQHDQNTDNNQQEENNQNDIIYGICCFCEGPCNPSSQSCGRCARELNKWYI